MRKKKRHNLRDSRWRSVIKALTWRVIATSVTGMLVWWATGDIRLSVGASVIDVVIKLVFYYGHERIWNKIAFGR